MYNANYGNSYSWHNIALEANSLLLRLLGQKVTHIYIYIFKASPSSQHQHCTDEAQKAETVLSAVRYSSLV